MILVDTSVWIEVLRNRSGEAQRLQAWLGGQEPVLARFTQLELLQGARDEKEWALLHDYLGSQTYLDPEPDCWARAARVYFDLRRAGSTVRSPIDCCIAQLGLDHRMTLLHQDRDFEAIAAIRSLSQIRFDQLS